MVSKNFRTGHSRQTLVAVGNLLVTLLPAQLESLQSAFSSKYSAEDFVDRYKNEVDAVANLSVPASRREPRVDSREQLVNLIKVIIKDTDLLARYINGAVPAADVPSALASATISTYRTDVRRNNWEATSNMLLGMTA